MSKIVETYTKRTPKCAEAHVRAEKSIVEGNSRASANFDPHPLTIVKAEGPTLTDVDGNEYLDLLSNFTSLIHGNSYPPIVEVAHKQVSAGTAWCGHNHWQMDLAETLVSRIPSMDSIRFVNSGSEAGALSLNIARAVTGRNKVLMSLFGYHGILSEFEHGGWGGYLLPNLGTTYWGEYGDAASFENILEEHGSEIAAVYLEPVMGGGGIKMAEPEFYHRVAAAARKAGSLFVADEVISFRLATGGTQTILGFEPDLTMLGKVIGGGFPVGAVGGKAEYMDVFEPARIDPASGKPRMAHSGTYCGNPLTMAAGFVSVQELTAERIDKMDVFGARLAGHLKAGAAKAGLPFSLNRQGSLMNIFFENEIPVSPPARADIQAMGLFNLAALNNGVQLATRGMIVLSTIMDEALIDDIGSRLTTAMAEVAAELN